VICTARFLVIIEFSRERYHGLDVQRRSMQLAPYGAMHHRMGQRLHLHKGGDQKAFTRENASTGRDEMKKTTSIKQMACG